MESHDVVRVATGSLVEVELWQAALSEAGIESRVVGDDLSAGLGTMLSAPIELWVKQEDVAKAEGAIRYSQERHEERTRHPNPESEHVPDPPTVHPKRTHPNPF